MRNIRDRNYYTKIVRLAGDENPNKVHEMICSMLKVLLLLGNPIDRDYFDIEFKHNVKLSNLIEKYDFLDLIFYESDLFLRNFDLANKRVYEIKNRELFLDIIYLRFKCKDLETFFE